MKTTKNIYKIRLITAHVGKVTDIEAVINSLADTYGKLIAIIPDPRSPYTLYGIFECAKEK